MNTRIRKLTGTAMLSAIAFVLMFIEFPIPLLMPEFIKMDFSDLPGLIGSFAYGPVAGIAVCLIKNLIHLMDTHTGGVGELSNFLLGAVFTGCAGVIYRKIHTKKGALIGSAVGCAAMGLASLVTNYYIVYPLYSKLMPMETIIAAYQIILKSADTLWKCLLIFNLPFTIIKGLCSVFIAMLIYKPLRGILKGAEG